MSARVEGDLRVTGNLTVNGTMPASTRAKLAQDPLAVYPLDLTAARVHDAVQTPLPGTSAADDLAVSGNTFGTDSVYLTTGDVKATSPTRYGRFVRVPLPAEYEAGETVRLRISAGMETTVADTSAKVDIEAYKVDRELGVGSDLCATAEQDMNNLVFADKDFTITSAGLSPGDVLDVRVKVAVVDGSTGTAVIASLGAIELLADIKG